MQTGGKKSFRGYRLLFSRKKMIKNERNYYQLNITWSAGLPVILWGSHLSWPIWSSYSLLVIIKCWLTLLRRTCSMDWSYHVDTLSSSFMFLIKSWRTVITHYKPIKKILKIVEYSLWLISELSQTYVILSI